MVVTAKIKDAATTPTEVAVIPIVRLEDKCSDESFDVQATTAIHMEIPALA